MGRLRFELRTNRLKAENQAPKLTGLRDPEITFSERHAAADRIGDPLCHPRHREATVEAEAVAAQVAPGVLLKVEGVEGSAEAGLEVAQQGVDPPELRQVVWMLAAGDDSPVVAVGCGHGAEAGQAIGKDMA